MKLTDIFNPAIAGGNLLPLAWDMMMRYIYKVLEIEDTILVQGIIDLYFIDKDDKLVLVDYKTDYVPEKNEQYLIEKYERQLKLYSRAIEEALNRKVNEIYIYSTYLDREILLKTVDK